VPEGVLDEDIDASGRVLVLLSGVGAEPEPQAAASAAAAERAMVAARGRLIRTDIGSSIL
jgi:hypothetical protein